MTKRMGAVALAAAATAATADVRGRAVEYKDGAVVLEGYLATDSARQGKRPAVLVVHEWWGVTAHPKRSAERLAAMGYVAFALDMYGKGKVAADAAEAGRMAGAVRGNPEIVRSRVRAALEVLRRDETVDPDRIAIIGYCFGGTVALEAARMGEPFVGVVSFHGGLASSVPAEQRKLTAKVLVLHGADDPAVPPAQVAAFEDEMRAAKADWQLVKYGGALHAFTNPEAGGPGNTTSRYDPAAARRSWRHMADFLAECFGAG